jgi:hypothetical protein
MMGSFAKKRFDAVAPGTPAIDGVFMVISFVETDETVACPP